LDSCLLSSDEDEPGNPSAPWCTSRRVERTPLGAAAMVVFDAAAALKVSRASQGGAKVHPSRLTDNPTSIGSLKLSSTFLSQPQMAAQLQWAVDGQRLYGILAPRLTALEQKDVSIS
jgi:hypothetical protein